MPPIPLVTSQKIYSASLQSCKKVSLVPQAQITVRVWFLKLCGKFRLTAMKIDQLNAKFGICFSQASPILDPTRTTVKLTFFKILAMVGNFFLAQRLPETFIFFLASKVGTKIK